MGYRSDIKLITTKEGRSRLQKAERKALDDESRLYCSDEHMRPVAGRYVLLQLEDVQWYEERDPQVGAIMAELRQFRDDGIPYAYIRVGEDYNDNEHHMVCTLGEYADMPNLWLKREIEVEY